MFCPKCGQPVGDGAQFCANCGNPVNGGAKINADSIGAKVKKFFADMQACADDRKGPEPVDFVKAIKLFGLYALNLKGRSSRSEYWWGCLFSMLASLVLPIVPVVGGLLSLAMVVPSFTLAVRRFHDIGKSGWYYLMSLIPLAGPIIFLVYMCTASQPQPNQFGPAGYFTEV